MASRKLQWLDRRTARGAACAALAALLAGCIAGQAPKPEEIRQQGLGSVKVDHPWKAGAAGEGNVQDNWLATFHDATLDSLVHEALLANPDIRIAGARMRQAAEYLVQARAPQYPGVAVGARGGLKESGGGGDPSSAMSGAVAAASWELDLWGRVRYGKLAAAEENIASQADYEFARQSLAAAVAKSWFTAIQLTQQARLTGEMADSSAKLAELAGDRERVGAGSDVDTALARATSHNLAD